MVNIIFSLINPLYIHHPSLPRGKDWQSLTASAALHRETMPGLWKALGKMDGVGNKKWYRYSKYYDTSIMYYDIWYMIYLFMINL